MERYPSTPGYSDDPLDAPIQHVMHAESSNVDAQTSQTSSLLLPPRKVPDRPLPGELAVLDSITTLHFRKSALLSEDKTPKVFPDQESSITDEQMIADSVFGGDGIADLGMGVPNNLLGSKSQVKQHLKGSGVQDLLATQDVMGGSGALSLLTGGSTISAWNSGHPSSAPVRLAAPSFNKYSKLEAKKCVSPFNGVSGDSAFDAAHLEFKLVDQPIVSTKGSGSDLTKPLNEACLMCQDAHMIDLCSGGGGGGGGSCSCKRCGWYCLGCMTCGAASCCLDKDCKCRNFKLGAIKCLDVACCHLPLGCKCLDLKGNCCPGGFQFRCQQISMQCGKCLTCGTLGWCVDEQCRCRDCKLAGVRCINGVCCHAPVACGCVDMAGHCCPGGWKDPCKKLGLGCLTCITCGSVACCVDADRKCRNCKLGAIRCLDVACCHLPLGCKCLDLKGNCCPGGFKLQCQKMSLQCGTCLTCGTLGCCLDDSCHCQRCSMQRCTASCEAGCGMMCGLVCGKVCGPGCGACAAQCSACSGHCSEQGWGGAWGCYRRLELSAQDSEGRELFHLQRGFAIPVHLCYPCGQIGVSPLRITVSAPSGALLGHVRTSGRAYSPSGWLDVFDADNQLLYSIQEKLWVWPFSSTFFPCLPNMYKPEKKLSILTTGGEKVGEIVHMYPGWKKAFYTAESNWTIAFPAGADAVHKALLIGACQLSKFYFFPGHVCGTGLGYFC